MSAGRIVQSMTGYGRATAQHREGRITVELRSTNHRYLELEPRLPGAAASLQSRLAEVIRGAVRRGRIEISVAIQVASRDRRRVTLDEPLLRRYHAQLRELKRRFKLAGDVTLDHLLALPHAVAVSEERPDQAWIAGPLLEAAREALRALVHARRREGAKLAVDLRRQLQALERHLRMVKAQRPKALERQRQALRQRLRELLGPDASRSAAQLEAAVALVKGPDIHEEIVRLGSHLSHMRQMLASASPVGKQLDFIAQELMRETNTMGAKVDDAAAVHHVVDMKSCIEKIREQVQNLE